MSDRCAGCGAPALVGGRFCPRCGQRLEGATDVVPTRARPRRAPPRRRRALDVEAPWREFRPALLLWLGMLAVNGALGLLSHLLDLSSPWYDVTATVVTATLTLACCAMDRLALAPALRGIGLDDRTWWHPLAAGVSLAIFMQLYFGALAHFGAEFGSYSEDYRLHGWPVWSMYLMVSLAPAVFEELAFRGFIQGRLGSLMGPREAVAVQAAMFSVLHMSPMVFPSHFVFGVVLGGLRRTTGSLYPGMVIHGLWNAFVLWEELRPS